MNFELQFLKSGKALCGKVFPNFVATFNWLVNFASNMKGDADVDATIGHIKVDRADPAHPVIRCAGCSGGGSSADEIDTSASAFGYVVADRSQLTGVPTQITVVNPYWWEGGVFKNKAGASYTVGIVDDSYVYADFMLPDEGTGGIELYEVNVATELATLPENGSSRYIIPLYTMKDGKIIDLRTSLHLQVWDWV